MPSNSIDFFYSFLLMMTIGTILTFSFSSYVSSLRQVSEVNQLKEVLNQVAAKATEALSIVTENNTTLSIVVRLPLTIGNNDFWIRLTNDSSKAWLEGAFGSIPRSGEQEHRVYLLFQSKPLSFFEKEMSTQFLPEFRHEKKCISHIDYASLIN